MTPVVVDGSSVQGLTVEVGCHSLSEGRKLSGAESAIHYMNRVNSSNGYNHNDNIWPTVCILSRMCTIGRVKVNTTFPLVSISM